MLVFVYGTLTDPAQVERVVEDYRSQGPATLVGLRRVVGRYPTLAPPTDESEDATVEGRLLRTSDVAALDAYEGVDDGLYVRVVVPVVDGAAADGDRSGPTESGAGTDDAAVYVGDPGRLDAPASWPGDGSFGARVRAYLRDHEVFVHPR